MKTTYTLLVTIEARTTPSPEHLAASIATYLEASLQYLSAQVDALAGDRLSPHPLVAGYREEVAIQNLHKEFRK